MKLRSSMTLFARATPDEPVFQQVLDRYFDGEPDPATDQRLPTSLLVGIGHLERRLDDAIDLLQAAGEGELMTNARRIMDELPIGSSARRFYRELADNAEHMMQWLSSSPFV
jgi:hypothetical protein